MLQAVQDGVRERTGSEGVRVIPFYYGLIADEIWFEYRPGKQHPDMHVRLARLNQTPVEAVFKLDRIVYDAVMENIEEDALVF